MAGTRIKNRVRLLDIAPTILEIAGVPVSSQMQGQSLLRIAQGDPQADLPAYARSDLAQQGFGCSILESWRAGKYLYIRAPKAELYDLANDTAATKNLAEDSKATLDTMASQLQSLDTRLATGHSAGNAGLTSSEMQKLASLGYVGLQKTSGGVSAQATGLDPKEIIALINQTLAAEADVGDGKPETAIPLLRRVLALRPDTYLAQYTLGVALTQQQQNAEAITHLHKAIELQPDSPWAHMAMGLSLIKTGDFKTAAVHLEIASAHLSASSHLHSKLAEVYEHLGRTEDAARERGKAATPEKEAAK
jgi:choline-sulfatase